MSERRTELALFRRGSWDVSTIAAALGVVLALAGLIWNASAMSSRTEENERRIETLESGTAKIDMIYERTARIEAILEILREDRRQEMAE